MHISDGILMHTLDVLIRMHILDVLLLLLATTVIAPLFWELQRCMFIYIYICIRIKICRDVTD